MSRTRVCGDPLSSLMISVWSVKYGFSYIDPYDLPRRPDLRNSLDVRVCGTGLFGPEDDPQPEPIDYRIVLPDSINICRDASWSFSAELLPYPQSADTAVYYSWTSTHRAGRLYLDYYTEYYAWTSTSPDAHYLAEYFARFDTLTCTAALQVGGGDLVPVAADTIFVRIGHPSIIDAGVLHGEIVWNETNTFYGWSVYVIYLSSRDTRDISMRAKASTTRNSGGPSWSSSDRPSATEV